MILCGLIALGVLLSPPEQPAGRLSLADLVAAAHPGDVVRVPEGDYDGVVTIDKPITLEGIGRPTIHGHGKGDLLLITAEGVTIRGFDFTGTGSDLDLENCAIRALAGRVHIEDNRLEDVLFGIDLRSAPDSVIRGNTIGGKDLDIARRGDGLRLWKSDRTRIEGNTIHDGRDAVIWYSEKVEVRGNLAHDCRYGFHLMYSHGVRIERNDLIDNSVGVYLMYSEGIVLADNRIDSSRGASGYGIGFKEVSDYTVARNLIQGNCAGIYMDAAPFKPGRAEIVDNVLACNDVAMALLPNVASNTIAGNAFVDNLQGIVGKGRGDFYRNAFELNGRGNWWSDYAGYDDDGDGVGEWVHEPVPLFAYAIEREPKLAILRFSPAEQLVEFVARAVPAMRPEPLFADESPLTHPGAESVKAWQAGREQGNEPIEGNSSALWTAASLLVAALLASSGGLR